MLDCVPEAALVRANRPEATALTGEHDPERAAARLLALGARLVAVTLGAGGVLLCGEDGLRERAQAPAVEVRSALGAGDAFTGTLLAAVGDGADAVCRALPAALREAARVCGWWGACD